MSARRPRVRGSVRPAIQIGEPAFGRGEGIRRRSRLQWTDWRAREAHAHISVRARRPRLVGLRGSPIRFPSGILEGKTPQVRLGVEVSGRTWKASGLLEAGSGRIFPCAVCPSRVFFWGGLARGLATEPVPSRARTPSSRGGLMGAPEPIRGAGPGEPVAGSIPAGRDLASRVESVRPTDCAAWFCDVFAPLHLASRLGTFGLPSEGFSDWLLGSGLGEPPGLPTSRRRKCWCDDEIVIRNARRKPVKAEPAKWKPMTAEAASRIGPRRVFPR